SVRRAAEKHRDADGLQARHFDGRAFAPGQSEHRQRLTGQGDTRRMLDSPPRDERVADASKALLVALDFGAPDYEESKSELCLLVGSAGLEVRGVVEGRRDRPDPSVFAGSGKVAEIG